MHADMRVKAFRQMRSLLEEKNLIRHDQEKKRSSHVRGKKVCSVSRRTRYLVKRGDGSMGGEFNLIGKKTKVSEKAKTPNMQPEQPKKVSHGFNHLLT